MATLSPFGPFRAFTNNGAPLNLGKLETYIAGTNTPKDTYTTSLGNIANSNPVILDANGYANVWLGTGSYKFILKDSADNTLWTIDDISGSIANTFGSATVTTAVNYNIGALNIGNLINCTAGLTISLLAAASANQGFFFSVINNGSGNVIIDPFGAETINGAATLTLYPGDGGIFICDGVSWYAVGNVPVSGITVNQISTSGSSGVALKNSGGTTVATFGPTNTTNVSFAGAVNVTGLVGLSAAVNEAKGADLASAATVDIGAATGNFVHITGVVTITSLGTAAAGIRRVVRFDGILTLTHNATSLILPGGVNITTAANDTATFVSEGSGNWRCVQYTKANGYPVVLITGLINTITVQTFTSSGTYTPSAGMVYCQVELVGGGGGGGGGVNSSGGGAGGYSRRILSAAQIGASQSTTIGAAGSAGVNGGPTLGGTGGTTSLGSLLSASGGVGGNTGSGTSGGSGGSGSTGDLNRNGQNGETSNASYSGEGGSSLLGPGARGVVTGAGVAATANTGGGGSGAFGAFGGGAGGSGIIIITEFRSV